MVFWVRICFCIFLFLQTVLTRKNTITGIEYRNDPIIFGWELINEPRCMTDPSGDTLQGSAVAEL